MLFLSCCLVDCNLYLILIMSCNPACTVGLMIFILVVSAGSLIDPLPIDCCSITDCICVCVCMQKCFTQTLSLLVFFVLILMCVVPFSIVHFLLLNHLTIIFLLLCMNSASYLH